MSRRSRKDEDFGLKSSSGVNYGKVMDRHIDDSRFERQKEMRKSGGSSAPVEQAPAQTPMQPSATMDAFMRMLTGKEERTIADRISDPNRPTWEQYKRENADKLNLGGDGEKEMREYRKKLDAAREKALSRNGKSQKKKKKKSSKYSSSDDDSDSDSSRRRSSSRKRSRKSKSRKRYRSSSSSSSDDSSSDDDHSSDSDDEERRSKKSRKSKKEHKRKHKKHKKKKKKARTKDNDESSPVRLSSFFQNGSDDDSE